LYPKNSDKNCGNLPLAGEPRHRDPSGRLTPVHPAPFSRHSAGEGAITEKTGISAGIAQFNRI